MARRLLDFDPVTGLMEWHEYDATEDKTHITYEQDCSDIIDRNKALQAENTGKMGDMVHVASIPASIQLKWLLEYGVDLTKKDHMPGVKRLLNNPEWRYLKVRNIIL